LAEFLSIKQTASRLGCGDRTIRRLIDGGRLPAVRVGSRIRIAVVDIEEHLAENRVTPKVDR